MPFPRRTKIVCTLGPASSEPKALDALIAAGMDVARLNFSHGDHASHARTISRLRAASRRAGKPVAILMDLQGPKIRVGKMRPGGVELKAGEALVVTSRPVLGRPGLVSTAYRALPRDVKKGDPILLDDGKMRLRVLSTRGDEVRCEVVHGGLLKDHKGMNLPGVDLSTPSVTAKDYADLAFGLERGVDCCALSFVRHPGDVARVKRFIARKGADLPVIAKIEMPQALDRLHAIVDQTDGVMVARGDLGVEMDLALVPLAQKEIIAAAHRSGAICITATQMLESMIEAPQPTRAEVSDVANAILDGTGAVMLSGETASGKHPVQACAAMDAICRATEAGAAFEATQARLAAVGGHGHRSVRDAVCYAARAASEDLWVKAILCFTRSGGTARSLARTRPGVPVLAFTPSRKALPRLSLLWGVEPRYLAQARNVEAMFDRACGQLKKERRVKPGDLLVMVAGKRTGASGTANQVRIHKIS